MMVRATSMRRVVCAVLLLGLWQAAPDAQERERDVTTLVIQQPQQVLLPVHNCTVAEHAGFLTQRLNVPSGIEFLPGKCQYPSPPDPRQEALQLQGMTVADAMNRLVQLDPRYYWTESDGVVVMRPLDAWTDQRHFLHTKIDALDLKNVNIGGALDALLKAMGERRTGMGQLIARSAEFSMTVGAGPAIEALDEIVRKHGRLRWKVDYCTPERRAETATIWLYQFDGASIEAGQGARAFGQPGAEGKIYDPCAGKSF